MVKSDGSKLAASEKTEIINFTIAKFGTQIDTYMNGKLVSLNTSYYPWKAYMSNGNDVAHSQLKSQLFFLDDDDVEDADPASGWNGGLAQPYQFTQQSRISNMEVPLYEYIFLLDKYLINGVDIHLKRFRNKGAFLTLSDGTSPSYKLELLDVVFKVFYMAEYMIE